MKPLEGLLVLDLCRATAGAYATMLMVDMGARVVKLEPRGVGRWAPEAALFDRGKESVFLDLADAAARPAFEALVRRADVLVEGFAPVEARRLRLSDDALAALNPRLIHCAMPPLGSTGPLAEAPADERVVDAYAGVYGDQGAMDIPCMYVHLPIAAYGAAFLAALGVAAALHAREATGRGQRVEVSLLAGALAMQSGTFPQGERLPGRVSVLRSQRGGLPAYRMFQCADGAWLFVACGNHVFWNKLCIALERPELATDPRYEGAPWAIRPEHHAQLHQLFEALFAARPREEWLRILEEADIPHGPILSRDEFVADPQVRHNGMVVEVEDPLLGPTRQTGVPVWLTATPGAVAGPAPLPGQHTAAVLQELEQAPPPVATPVVSRQPSASTLPTPAPGGGATDVSPGPPPPGGGGSPSSAPYQGVLIVDLAGYIAGGYASGLLADLGATVIKVEAPQGDAFRALAPGFCGWNRGKRGVVLNLAHARGREVLYRMVERADAVVENYRAGVAKRLGADYETLSAINPRLVYCSVTGYGQTGPYSGRPAFDPVLQARSGAMAAQGGDGPPVFLRVAISDYATAMLAAWGVALGLWARHRTGRGQHLETCLLNGAMAVQAGEFLAYPGQPPPEYLDPYGPRADRRIYPTSDGWLFVSCAAAAQRRALLRAVGLEGWPQGDGAPLPPEAVPALEARFRAGTTAAWLERLRAAGVPCAPVRKLGELHQDPQVAALGLVVQHDSQEYGRVQQLGVPLAFSLTPGVAQRAAPALGQHTDEVLQEFGYSAAEVAELRRQGVVA